MLMLLVYHVCYFFVSSKWKCCKYIEQNPVPTVFVLYIGPLPVIRRSFFWSVFSCIRTVQIRSFFWCVFSCIRTEYGDLLRKSSYSVQIQESNDQKNSVFGQVLRSELTSAILKKLSLWKCWPIFAKYIQSSSTILSSKNTFHLHCLNFNETL